MLEPKVLLVVRMEKDLRRKVKLQAWKDGTTMQDWIIKLIEAKIKNSKTRNIWLCQECGDWTLVGTQVARLSKCEQCGKENPTFPCKEE